MKVRIKEDPRGNMWWVEYKYWFMPYWKSLEVYIGKGCQEEAIETAKRLKRPSIIEVI